MGYVSVKDVQEENKSWDFLQHLPQSIDGFTKSIPNSIEDDVLCICRYENKELRCAVEFLYSPLTFDYALAQRIGLNYYRDIRFFYKERDIFAEKAEAALSEIIRLMVKPQEYNLGEMVARKGVLNWEYGNALPDRIGAFECFIKPCNAIEYINGSIVFLDYTDFARGNQLVFYYNRLRNQIFAEKKLAGVFRADKDYDCDTLKELEELLKKKLRDSLEQISKV